MDAISILNGVKNKVLDAKNYELLKRTYDLQNQNIEQLKTSNEGFKEENKRLREEVDGLKAENESLKPTVAELTQKVSQLSEHIASAYLSDVAVAVLYLYHKLDRSELWDETDIIPSLINDFRRIQIESGIDDLMKAKMIKRGSYESDVLAVDGEVRGRRSLYLTPEGKKYVIENINGLD